MYFIKRPAKRGGMREIRVLWVRTHLFSFRSRSLPAPPPPLPPPPASPREKVASLEAASRIPRACPRSCPPDLAAQRPFPRAPPSFPARGHSPRYPRNPTSSPGREDSCSKSHDAATPLEKNIRFGSAISARTASKRIFSFLLICFYF